MRKCSPLSVLRSQLGCALLLVAAMALSGCATMAKVGTAVGEATGAITPEQAASINRTAEAADKAMQKITPEQEYYIGRAVAATMLGAYKPYDNAKANQYLNMVGQPLAQVSDKPETFGGYHFLLLDTDEVNAFAAPGGLILVSRGMLKLTSNEDELAAVLAHEIGHVQGEHGLRAIKKGRWTSAFTILGAETAKSLGGQQLAQLTQAFEGAVSDVVNQMVNTGYARSLESQADAAAITILSRIGYNPSALVTMLEHMEKQVRPGGPGFGKTHPDPADRIAAVKKLVGTVQPVAKQPNRQKRFAQALGDLAAK